MFRVDLFSHILIILLLDLKTPFEVHRATVGNIFFGAHSVSFFQRALTQTKWKEYFSGGRKYYYNVSLGFLRSYALLTCL
jgi:hypothetical protein